MASTSAEALVQALPAYDDDDDDQDDLIFSKDYRPEEGMLLGAKEADFRTFLCDSGAADEIVRLLVGLAESPDRPENPVAFLRAMFDSQELPEMVQGRKREDIPAILELNSSLHAQVAELTAQLDETKDQIDAAEAAAAAPLLQGLIDAYGADTLEGALDVSKVYAAASARFPPPPEPAGEEDEATPPPPQPWAEEGVEPPSGTVTAESFASWAKSTFGYGSSLVADHGPEMTVALFAKAAAPAEEELEIDDAKAKALYAAFLFLADFTEEAKAPAAAEE